MKQKSVFRSVMAGIALLLACAACCALPLLSGAAAAGVLSGTVAEFGSINPWLVGGSVAVLVAIVGAMWLAVRRRPQ